MRTIEVEVDRIKEKIKPDEDAIETLRRREKLLQKIVDTGVEFEEVAVMEVPDESLNLMLLIDKNGVVVGDRPFGDDDLQEKLV